MGVMDLEGMDIDDNVGGRPTKEEREEQDDTTVPEGTPWYPKREEGFLKDKWEEHYDEDEGINRALITMSGELHLMGRSVIVMLQERDIYDFTEHEGEFDWLDRVLEANGFIGSPSSSSSSSGSSGFLSSFDDDDDEDEEPKSGLKALVSDSKK